MILAVAAISLLISERGFDCHSKQNCPLPEEIRAAVLEYENARLQKVEQIWMQNSGPDTIITGPHMIKMDGVDNIRCVNETEDKEWASCSFSVNWGNLYRENFIADLRVIERK